MDLNERIETLRFQYKIEDEDPTLGVIKLLSDMHRDLLAKVVGQAGKHSEAICELDDQIGKVEELSAQFKKENEQLKKIWRSTSIRAHIATVLVTSGVWILVVLLAVVYLGR